MNTPQAHLVDDDEAIRDALAWLLKSRDIPCTTYDCAEAFLAAWTPKLAGCVILDMRMPGMSGLDCFDALGERQSALPVIFLTGHGDVPLAVATLKKGAFDFLRKTVQRQRPCNSASSEAMDLDARTTRGECHGRLGKLAAFDT
jgi:two-component system response regulator DctR